MQRYARGRMICFESFARRFPESDRVGENVRAKVQRDCEEAVAYGNSVAGAGRSDLTAARVGCEQGEAQIIAAAGGTGAVVEPALIGERCAWAESMGATMSEASAPRRIGTFMI